MQEGLAHVCILTPTMTIVRAKIETSVPRKRKGSGIQISYFPHSFKSLDMKKDSNDFLKP